MKTVVTSYNKIHFLYPCDLEKKSTKELINILRGLRRDESIKKQYPYNKDRDLEGDWLEYAWDDYEYYQENYYSMIWMVKKVLAGRENIALSKAAKKEERREKATQGKKKTKRYVRN